MTLIGCQLGARTADLKAVKSIGGGMSTSILVPDDFACQDYIKSKGSAWRI